MTPEIHEKYKKLKLFTDSMAGLLLVFDENEFLEFEQTARIHADGTLTPIALHYMSMKDLDLSQNNLQTAIRVSETLRRLKSLLIRVKPEGEKE